MPAIKAISFDMDGLLFNTEELYDQVGSELVRRRGHELDVALVTQMMGQQACVALQLMIDHYGLDDSIETLQAETEEIFERILPDQLAPMPGAIDLLERLSAAGVPMALTTSSHARAVGRAMELIDLQTHFRFHLTAEDVERSKPHPEIYLTAAARFEESPDEMLVFEDSEHGCRAGVEAGAIVVAVPSKHGDLHDFSRVHFVADSLADPRIEALLEL